MGSSSSSSSSSNAAATPAAAALAPIFRCYHVKGIIRPSSLTTIKPPPCPPLPAFKFITEALYHNTSLTFLDVACKGPSGCRWDGGGGIIIREGVVVVVVVVVVVIMLIVLN